MGGLTAAGTGPDSLGVIIALPPGLAAEVDQWRASYGGAEAVVVPPHITLVSGTATGDWSRAAGHVRRVARAARPFTVRLRGTGTFRPASQVVYLNVAAGAQECVRLHEQLQTGPLRHEPSFAFHPHLTIAHDEHPDALDRAERELAGFEATFEVTALSLFDAVGGAWTLREELPLDGVD